MESFAKRLGATVTPVLLALAVAAPAAAASDGHFTGAGGHEGKTPPTHPAGDHKGSGKHGGSSSSELKAKLQAAVKDAFAAYFPGKTVQVNPHFLECRTDRAGKQEHAGSPTSGSFTGSCYAKAYVDGAGWAAKLSVAVTRASDGTVSVSATVIAAKQLAAAGSGGGEHHDTPATGAGTTPKT